MSEDTQHFSNPSGQLIVEPFLHRRGGDVYNPFTGQTLSDGNVLAEQVKSLADGHKAIDEMPVHQIQLFRRDGWLVEDEGRELARRFRLRVATLEASTVCNQSCFFCPVSTDRRDADRMEMDFYESIVRQLAEYRDTLEGVFMINYNEPTADPRFVEQVTMLIRHGLKPAVNTNGTGLSPEVADAVMDLGGIRFLSVNLSTIDRDNYKRDRGRDHLDKVLRNLDYVSSLQLAEQMDIAVLGSEDDEHDRQFTAISERYGETCFNVKKFPIMNRAGWMDDGDRPAEPIASLGGCENLGSRPIEHVHINPAGECILCCQDYGSNYVIGDLHNASLNSILSGDKAAAMRRQAYGLEDAADDFICRHCTFAICRSQPRTVEETS